MLSRQKALILVTNLQTKLKSLCLQKQRKQRRLNLRIAKASDKLTAGAHTASTLGVAQPEALTSC